MNLRGNFMLHLRAHLRFHFWKSVKMHNEVKKKIHFMLQLMIHLTVQSRGSSDVTFDGAPKDVLNDLHKDVQEGACEVSPKGAFGVELEFHLWLHFLMQ